MRNTRLEVDLDKFINNINIIKNHSKNKEIIPVVKANAYGTYINKRLDILNMFNIIAVALVEEAIEIRELGYKKEILVLNQPGIDEINDIEKYNITTGVCDKEFIQKLIEKNKGFKIHLEIETGMNRTGINIDKLDKIIKLLNNSNILIEGVYSHFSSADYDEEYTTKQINIFKKALNIIKTNKIDPKYIHISASNGIINYNSFDFTNAIRPGIIMYGYEPFPNSSDKLKTDPITKLITKITFIKKVSKGQAISYNQKYICEEDKIIATIPIGYADGYKRSLINNAHVYINGKYANVVGTICMDSCMIDITNIENVKVGDKVIIYDDINIKLDELATKTNTINYEFLTNISYRVPRKFIKKEN